MERSRVKVLPQAASLPRAAGKSLRLLRIALWLLIPIGMWWAFRGIPLAEVGKVLNQVSLEKILVLIGLNAIIFILFTSRWWMILSALGYRRSLSSLAGYRLAAFGVTYFTPGPQFGGEPLQVYLLKQRDNLPTEIAAASVATDKLLELLANFSFLLVGVMVILTSNVLGSAPLEILLIPASLLILPIGYLAALWLGLRPISWIAGKIAGQFHRSTRLNATHRAIRVTEQQVARFCKQNPVILLAAATLSTLIWGFMVFEFSLMLQFLGLHLSLFQVLTALTAARIAFLLPLPAGLGSLEAGQVMAMGLFGLNPALGLSLSLMIRVRDIILGAAGLGLGGLLSR